ncbi:MAG: 2-oxoacid:ferredoxin oxidoreductase subunit beta [Acidimicrobiales bacterium]|jgi:2-oxoglutarate ferredoxin oxidoreductase subunit beta|nr:2-oxoacid:ferredoxin oxidoreductase subunit beta [Acidimicrobiales bacterium]MDP6299361.1 2-oxoacid:ferredoxin oxidoreductase subunit beta [Acidimicrobiales bacterium]HJM28741.1 2-oxoacid:ferredoxin oxidoreductase subunit beta [Acidimicrobiales bacterium]HJM96664.1 2-oxoacid:ferredoxin oxidoreductase subunit beta [Acidimicrobiales bacterium]
MTDTAPARTTTKAEWTSDQEPRWCPGCGDYSVLTAMQLMLPELGALPEETVFISGIGCAARFPYYMDTYGMHSIHGRAPAVATGLAISRPELDVWVIGGDGDMLSIGGNHLIHAMRRNIDLTILLFNNQIYGLTKGQYSPTSEVGKITKSTPVGSIDQPFNAVSVALGAEATFVARTHDMDRKHMQETFKRAHAHKGSSLVEIYQNCNVFNDGAFAAITKKDKRDSMLIQLTDGEPIRFGVDKEFGVISDQSGNAQVVKVDDVGEASLIVHDETCENSSMAFALSRLSSGPYEPTPMGVFRSVKRPEYAKVLNQQIAVAKEQNGEGELHELLRSQPTWIVE